jgi:hypothetical protein
MLAPTTIRTGDRRTWVRKDERRLCRSLHQWRVDLGHLQVPRDRGAAARRALGDIYAKTQPELALGDALLGLLERQAADYTFEGMSDLEGSHAGFVVWHHAFVESRWLDLGGRFHWLWIRARPLGFVVAEEFEPLPEQRERQPAHGR